MTNTPNPHPASVTRGDIESPKDTNPQRFKAYARYHEDTGHPTAAMTPHDAGEWVRYEDLTESLSQSRRETEEARAEYTYWFGHAKEMAAERDTALAALAEARGLLAGVFHQIHHSDQCGDIRSYDRTSECMCGADHLAANISAFLALPPPLFTESGK